MHIEWRFIARIITDQTQSIEMIDGTRLLGTLQRSDDENHVVIATYRGPMTVDPTEIVAVWPVEATFLDRMELDLSVGLDYTSSTDIGNLTSAVDFFSRSDERVTEASLRTDITRQSNGDEQTRLELRGSHERLMQEQRFRTWNASIETNEAQGLDLRATFGASFGKYLKKTNNNWFSVSAGLQASEEVPSEGGSETNLEAVGNIRYRFWRFADPERSVDVNFSVFPSLTDGGRYRTDLRTTFKLEFWDDFFWALELYHSYDSDPLSTEAEVEKSDYGVTTSIGWSY